jgi:hypothetical protein
LWRFPINSLEQALKKACENILLMDNGVNSVKKKREERIQNLSITDLFEQYEENFQAQIKVVKVDKNH